MLMQGMGLKVEVVFAQAWKWICLLSESFNDIPMHFEDKMKEVRFSKSI